MPAPAAELISPTAPVSRFPGSDRIPHMDELIRNIAVYALPVLFAITLHEAAHAYAAKFFGDNTAYAAGRMSLNPINHIDPFGTILIPVLLYLSTGFVFGYAKPVPIDFSRLRNPKRDMAWVALAGPGANFLMALLWLIFAAMLVFFDVNEPFPHKWPRPACSPTC
jgi:Zn-dependent protease